MLQVFKKIFLKKIILSYHNSLTPPSPPHTHTHTRARTHTHTHARTYTHTLFSEIELCQPRMFSWNFAFVSFSKTFKLFGPGIRMQSCQLTKKTLPNMLIQVFCLQPSFSQDASRWLLPKRLWNCANTLLL